MHPRFVSSHHFGSTLEHITLNDNLFWILGHFIALPINVSLGSMNVIDDICTLQGVLLSWVFLTLYFVLFLKFETMLHHPTIVVQLLHLLFHSIELEFDLIVFVDFKSPCDSHSSPFNYSYLVNRLL